MAVVSAPSPFSARAHGPGYWFGSAAVAVGVALVVILLDIVGGEHIAFWGPLVVAAFAVVQGIRSIVLRRRGTTGDGD